MSNQKSKISVLENKIEALETLILAFEDNAKFLKDVIASQNDTIKALLDNRSSSSSFLKNEEDIVVAVEEEKEDLTTISKRTPDSRFLSGLSTRRHGTIS